MYNGGQLGGVIGCGGLFCADIDWTKIDIAAKTNVPVALYHGNDDTLIDVEFAEKTYLTLKNVGLEQIEFCKEDGLDHTMSETQNEVLSRWIRVYSLKINESVS
jgi:predicted esterase